MNLSRLLTPEQVVERCPAISMGTLRRLLLHRRSNGFARCVIQLGARLAIDEEEMAKWLEERRAEPVGSLLGVRRGAAVSRRHRPRAGLAR